MSCPNHWVNFIQSLQDDPYREVRMKIIQRELAKYGARYCVGDHHESGDFVAFESEKMLNWFIMRWS